METIYTIPVNEAFDASLAEQNGCPICRLYRKLEEDELARILGAAMMEPDVRIETNAEGFCDRHLDRLFHRKNRLGLALILESHLSELSDKIFADGIAAKMQGPATVPLRHLKENEDTCYLCRRIGANLSRMTETVSLLYEADNTFRKKLAEVPYFCLPHYRLILEQAKRKMNKKLFPAFYQTLKTKEEAKMQELQKDVAWFVKKFDYRYENEPWNNAKDAVERTIAFLSGSEKDQNT